MGASKALLPTKPAHYTFPLQTGRQAGKQRAVGAIGPAGEVVDGSVALGVAVDVADQMYQIALLGHGDTLKGLLKETARPVKGFVDRFGIGVEKVAKLAAGRKGQVVRYRIFCAKQTSQTTRSAPEVCAPASADENGWGEDNRRK